MSYIESSSKQPVGLILSGGGARAAYQIGVLRAIANILPKHASNPFQVISGTSAGALNAVSLATHAHRLRTGVKTLEYVWKNISSEKVYNPQSANLLASASSVLLSMFSNKPTSSPVALLNNEPLATLLSRVIKFDRIQKNIDAGLLNAVSVTASAYDSGESVSFYQAVAGVEDWQGPHRIGIRTQLHLQHLMASSAIPVIFPAEKIGSHYFGDGAIRQLAPTSTALHLGARKILAVGVSANKNAVSIKDELQDLSEADDSLEDINSPHLTQILGHILNSAFVDTLDNDLEFLRNMNELIPNTPARWWSRKTTRSEIELLEISPSKELHHLALEYYDELPKSMARYIKSRSSGTLLSLVLFEPGFCNALRQMGFEDALSKETEIRDFFRVQELA